MSEASRPEASRPEPSRRCPYCAEEIRAEAIKCRHCGSQLDMRSPLTRTWHRSRDGKMVAGVCAGLADEFGISVTILRLAFVLGTIVGGGMGLVVYLVLWAVMPYRSYAGVPVLREPAGR
jgi:phage shock protein PspC (stress-responsive transcriptional regulator)